MFGRSATTCREILNNLKRRSDHATEVVPRLEEGLDGLSAADLKGRCDGVVQLTGKLLGQENLAILLPLLRSDDALWDVNLSALDERALPDLLGDFSRVQPRVRSLLSVRNP